MYPAVAPTDHFYEVLPLLSGEMVSYFRGRGHELHSLRDYLPTDSARLVDWKVTARAGHLMVREFAREDERRVMLVLDPFVGPPPAAPGASVTTEQASSERAAAEHTQRFERAVSMAACIAWHFNEINSVLQFRTNRFATPMAPAEEIIYDALRELAKIQPDQSSARRRISRRTRLRPRNLQNHPDRTPAKHNSHRAVVVFVFSVPQFAVIALSRRLLAERLSLRTLRSEL